jgi:hypothetical protein
MISSTVRCDAIDPPSFLAPETPLTVIVAALSGPARKLMVVAAELPAKTIVSKHVVISVFSTAGSSGTDAMAEAIASRKNAMMHIRAAECA